MSGALRARSGGGGERARAARRAAGVCVFDGGGARAQRVRAAAGVLIPPPRVRAEMTYEAKRPRRPAAAAVYVSNPPLEAALTGLFLLECGGLAWVFRGEPFILAALGAMLLVTKAAADAARYVALRVGVACSERLIEGNPLSKAVTRRKLQEQAWQLTVHVIMSVVEAPALSGDNRPTTIAEVPTLVKWCLMMQLAIYTCAPRPWAVVVCAYRACGARSCLFTYIHAYPRARAVVCIVRIGRAVGMCSPPCMRAARYTTVQHRWFDERRKDYFVMFVHHVVTVGIICGAVMLDHWQYGLYVVFLHDVSGERAWGTRVFVLNAFPNVSACGRQRLSLGLVAHVC